MTEYPHWDSCSQHHLEGTVSTIIPVHSHIIFHDKDLWVQVQLHWQRYSFAWMAPARTHPLSFLPSKIRKMSKSWHKNIYIRMLITNQSLSNCTPTQLCCRSLTRTHAYGHLSAWASWLCTALKNKSSGGRNGPIHKF